MAKSKNTDPRFFDVGKYKNWLAGFALLILTCPAFGQNRAIVTSPEYVIFRFGKDTLDTALLPSFFLNVCKFSDTLLAFDQAKRCVLFLHSNPHGVDHLDSAMLKVYKKGMLAYAVYYRRKDKELIGLKRN